MVRMLEGEEMRRTHGAGAPVGERVKDRAAPSVEEVRALVEGPPKERQIRWMRWLAVFALLVVAAGTAAFVALRDGTETAQYQVPSSSEATRGALTRSDYLPETSGEVYNFLPELLLLPPAPEAGGPTQQEYLPVTSGEVYNLDPALIVVSEVIGYDEAGLPYYSAWGPIAVANADLIGYDEAGLPYYSHWGVVGYDEAGLPYYSPWG